MNDTATEIPVYDHGHAPRGLYSRRQLAARGLRPIAPECPDARIRWSDATKPPYAVYADASTELLPAAPTRDQRRADRDAASAWARKVLADPRAVVIDTETTGLSEPEVIEIAAVAADGTVLVDTLLKPTKPAEDSAVAVHGISNDTLAQAHPLSYWKNPLDSLLRDRTVIAWNGRYDQQALARTFDVAGIARPEWVDGVWHDAMFQHARHIGEWEDTRGQYRVHQLTGGTHRAAADCLPVWETIHTMAGNAPDRRTLETVRDRITNLALNGDAADAETAFTTVIDEIDRLLQGSR